MTVRGKRSQTRHVPSRPATFRSSGYRLLVESLEARGMLSATVGSPVEPIDSDFDAEPATVAVDQGEESVALASDVSLFVCPEFESTGDDASQLALDEAIDPVWEFDTWTGWIDDGESLLDTALPPTSVDGPYAPEEWDFTAADGWSGDGGGIATGCFLVTSTFDLDLPYLLHETISPQENRFLEIVPSSASTLMMWPSVDYPLTFEYCVLPLPVDLGSVDAEPLADSQLDDFKLDDFRPDADIQATASDTPAPAPVPSTNSIPSNWMAAFATSLPGAGGESSQPVTGRRRSR